MAQVSARAASTRVNPSPPRSGTTVAPVSSCAGQQPIVPLARSPHACDPPTEICTNDPCAPESELAPQQTAMPSDMRSPHAPELPASSAEKYSPFGKSEMDLAALKAQTTEPSARRP